LFVSSYKLSPLIPFRENLQVKPSGRDLQGEPLSNSQDKVKQKVSLFERGRDLERGRSPLSPTLPSPATSIYEFLPMSPAGEACLRVAAPAKAGDRGEATTYQPNANGKLFLISA